MNRFITAAAVIVRLEIGEDVDTSDCTSAQAKAISIKNIKRRTSSIFFIISSRWRKDNKMKLDTNIKSIEAEVQRDRLLILSKIPLRILSSAVLNGGLCEADGILSVHVSEDGCEDGFHRDPNDFLRKKASKLNLHPDRIVGLMTAADLRNVDVGSRRYEDVIVTILVTAGTSFAATAGDEIASKQKAGQFKKLGTINIITLVDGNLTESCMVGAVNTITEAKTVALRELDIRSRFSGELASGTITDSVVVACTKSGNPIKYAGTATMLGELIGKSVKETVKKAISKQENQS